jgi:malonyl-CoA/methylmalonyl-CoA synthetase
VPDHLFDLIRSCAPADGAPFIRTRDGRVITYGEAFALSAQMANVMVSEGVVPGDRLAAQVEKSPDALILYLACLRAGAVYVPLNPAYTPAEIEYFLGDAEPKLFIRNIDQLRLSPSGGEAASQSDAERGSQDSRHPLSPTLSPNGEEGALAAVLYTSGTTGKSKGAMLTHANLASNAIALRDAWRWTRGDVLIHALPIFHTHGLFVATNVTLVAGASMIFLPKFDADEIFRALPQATTMMGVPTFYTRLLADKRLTREATKHIRLFVSGSAPLAAETHREWRARTGHAILERYGMTETSMITSNPYDGERVPGSVGLPLPGVSVRIANVKDGIGMIEVKGPNVFAGYWRQPEKTAQDFHDGWFVTGDLGRIDARGYVFIVGRGKDLIISGGFNVYPKEIEDEIDALPGVAESAVIGLPHADFGEGVTAVVVPRKDAGLSEGAIVAALRDRLANYKIPKRVVFVDELPRNAMGKVQKNVLRERYKDLYQSRHGRA